MVSLNGIIAQNVRVGYPVLLACLSLVASLCISLHLVLHTLCFVAIFKWASPWRCRASQIPPPCYQCCAPVWIGLPIRLRRGGLLAAGRLPAYEAAYEAGYEMLQRDAPNRDGQRDAAKRCSKQMWHRDRHELFRGHDRHDLFGPGTPGQLGTGAVAQLWDVSGMIHFEMHQVWCIKYDVSSMCRTSWPQAV